MKKIAVTGGIATGKSAVAEYLKKKNKFVLCADEIYAGLLVSNKKLCDKIAGRFGSEMFTNGILNRSALGKIVFNDKKKLQILNKISHPFIKKKISELLKERKNESTVFITIPLLFESKMENEYDAVITVYCNKNQQIARLVKRNGYSIADAKRRINSQLPINEKKAKSDFIIDNSHTLKNTHKQIDIIIEKI